MAVWAHLRKRDNVSGCVGALRDRKTSGSALIFQVAVWAHLERNKKQVVLHLFFFTSGCVGALCYRDCTVSGCVGALKNKRQCKWLCGHT